MASTQGLLIIERILRDRDSVWRQIVEDRDLRPLSTQLLSSAAICLALFGAVLGASNGWAQALSSAVKLPILFFVTLAICLPTLYLFNLVFGARLSIRQALALVSVAVTVLSTLSLAFAPISLFFLITAPGYYFYKLLNVAILMLTALVGLKFLVQGMRAMNTAAHPAPARTPPEQAKERDFTPPVAITVGASGGGSRPEQQTMTEARTPAPNGSVPASVATPDAHHGQNPQSASMTLLYVWIIVFGFVGTQLAWTLRPFFGDPNMSFQIFRAIDGNFYVDIVHTIGRLLT